SGGVTQRGRIAIPGTASLTIDRGRWRIEAGHRAGGAVPLAVVASGVLNDSAIGNSTLNGRLTVMPTDVAALVRLLRTSGVADIGDDVVSAGMLSAEFALHGRLTSPTVDGSIDARDLAGMQF